MKLRYVPGCARATSGKRALDIEKGGMFCGLPFASVISISSAGEAHNTNSYTYGLSTNGVRNYASLVGEATSRRAR